MWWSALSPELRSLHLFILTAWPNPICKGHIFFMSQFSCLSRYWWAIYKTKYQFLRDNARMLFPQIIAGQTVPVHIHELAVSFVCINVSSKLKKRGKTKQTERMRLTQSGQRWRKVWKSGGPGGKYTLIVLVNFCPVLNEFFSWSFVYKNFSTF